MWPNYYGCNYELNESLTFTPNVHIHVILTHNTHWLICFSCRCIITRTWNLFYKSVHLVLAEIHVQCTWSHFVKIRICFPVLFIWEGWSAIVESFCMRMAFVIVYDRKYVGVQWGLVLAENRPLNISCIVTSNLFKCPVVAIDTMLFRDDCPASDRELLTSSHLLLLPRLPVSQ